METWKNQNTTLCKKYNRQGNWLNKHYNSIAQNTSKYKEVEEEDYKLKTIIIQVNKINKIKRMKIKSIKRTNSHTTKV